MLRFVADENFNRDVVRGVLRRIPDADLVTVQDEGLSGRDDPDVLEWSARQGRVVLTHDARTMTKFAYDRVIAGLSMPGVVEVGPHISIGVAIDEIVTLALASFEGEWEGQVLYLPLH